MATIMEPFEQLIQKPKAYHLPEQGVHPLQKALVRYLEISKGGYMLFLAVSQYFVKTYDLILQKTVQEALEALSSKWKYISSFED